MFLFTLPFWYRAHILCIYCVYTPTYTSPLYILLLILLLWMYYLPILLLWINSYLYFFSVSTPYLYFSSVYTPYLYFSSVYTPYLFFSSVYTPYLYFSSVFTPTYTSPLYLLLPILLLCIYSYLYFSSVSIPTYTSPRYLSCHENLNNEDICVEDRCILE